MTNPFANLRAMGCALVAAAFLIGGCAIWLWTQSNADWERHQNNAFSAGVTVYYALQNGTAPPPGIQITQLAPADQDSAAQGHFRKVSGAQPAAKITNIPISADPENTRSGAPLVLAILSPDITYSLADLPNRTDQTAAETMGAIARKLASFCSDPVVLARMGDARWVRIEGLAVWGCAASPADRRLIAVFLAILGIGVLMTSVLNLSSEFTTFAHQLRNRRRIGGPTSYDTQGPQELQDIVSAVNAYLEVEREQLASRAAILSGVSHDLGTPATRLRLRAALISDPDLRRKLETDIDSMTGIIESVLSYTHAEMDAEMPLKMSVNSLIDAIVADYQDVGKPVRLNDSSDLVVQGGSSIFMSRQGQSTVSQNRDIVISGRPIALERAITNLIDNALKYGRRANLGIEADADSVTVVVQDEGATNSAKEIEALLEPFKRGGNTATIDGHGLGLTIVATIAKLHGGTLEFEDKAGGVAARLSVQRH